MNKQEFIANLRRMLSDLPKSEVEERLNFYSEMIDDRMEEGFSEEDAVLEIGSLEKLSAQITADVSSAKVTKEKIKTKKRLKPWEIVLLAFGSPIWLALLVATFVVIFSLYVVSWSVIVSLWAVFASLIGCVLGGVVASVIFICQGNVLTGIALIGAGFVCAGLSVFLFFGCNATTKCVLYFTKKIAYAVKKNFVGKERN